MFGISFTEIGLIALVVLIVVGPQKLPGLLRTVGEWIGKARRLTTEVRHQTGIDELLQAEGLAGGLSELRSMMRGDFRDLYRGGASNADHGPYPDTVTVDPDREYPPEGPDAHNALPDDLLEDDPEPSQDLSPEPEPLPDASVDSARPV